jgi:hypothetical protein
MGMVLHYGGNDFMPACQCDEFPRVAQRMSGASDGRSCTRVRLLSGMLAVQCTIHRPKARRFSSPSMLVTGVSTRSHRRHTMPAVVGQTSTMDTWVT